MLIRRLSSGQVETEMPLDQRPRAALPRRSFATARASF